MSAVMSAAYSFRSPAEALAASLVDDSQQKDISNVLRSQSTTQYPLPSPADIAKQTPNGRFLAVEGGKGGSRRG